MKLPDANVLLYAINSTERHHSVARSWLDTALTGVEPVAFAWIVVVAFLRISTSRRAFARPLDVPEAATVMHAWLEQPAATLIEPSPRHWTVLRGLVESLGTGGNIVNDAHLATLAIEHGAEVVSFDVDFTRFPALHLHRLA